MSQVAGYNGNASEELASIIRDRIQAFCEFLKTSQFDKMAQFYSRRPAPNQDANPVFYSDSGNEVMGSSYKTLKLITY